MEAEVEGLPIRNPRKPVAGMGGPEPREATSRSSPVSNDVHCTFEENTEPVVLAIM